jgi:septal ring factor EnvC (AmiA/AmiB activator)
MSEERTITTVFRADISNFSASTQQLNRYVAQVNSEFKDATASMGRWNDNAEGLRAKITQLNKLYDAESRKLKDLEASYAEVVRTQGANSKAAQKLATDINNQSATVKETKKNIDYYTDSLKELEDAGVETKEELDKLNKELEEQKQAAKDLGGGVLKNVATGVVGIGAACIGAFAAVNSIVEETKELRTQMAQLETTFTQAGHSVDASKKTYDELFSVLGDSGKATEASMHIAQMAKNEKELADISNILTGVYATFGDSLPVEGLAEAMNHTAKLGSVQGNLADALEWAGVNVDDFNAHLETLNTEEERAAHINSTLNGLYGETATKYKEVNKEVIAANDAQNKYNQAMADLGEKAQPIITDFKLVMVDALGWILDNKDMVIAGVAGIGAAFVAWKVTTIVQGAVGAVKALSAATKGQTIAQTALNLVMKANPLGIIVTAVAGLTAAFIVLWNKCEGFRNFWKGFVNGLIGGVNALIKGINKLKIDIPEWVPEWGGKSLGFNIPLIPKLAKGGVVDRATLAMIGEAGKEAIVPLERTDWVDKLAEKISAKGGTTTKTYNITNKFERMETSRIALHKANLETKRILKEA